MVQHAPSKKSLAFSVGAELVPEAHQHTGSESTEMQPPRRRRLGIKAAHDNTQIPEGPLSPSVSLLTSAAAKSPTPAASQNLGNTVVAEAMPPPAPRKQSSVSSKISIPDQGISGVPEAKASTVDVAHVDSEVSALDVQVAAPPSMNIKMGAVETASKGKRKRNDEPALPTRVTRHSLSKAADNAPGRPVPELFVLPEAPAARRKQAKCKPERKTASEIDEQHKFLESCPSPSRICNSQQEGPGRCYDQRSSRDSCTSERVQHHPEKTQATDDAHNEQPSQMICLIDSKKEVVVDSSVKPTLQAQSEETLHLEKECEASCDDNASTAVIDDYDAQAKPAPAKCHLGRLSVRSSRNKKGAMKLEIVSTRAGTTKTLVAIWDFECPPGKHMPIVNELFTSIVQDRMNKTQAQLFKMSLIKAAESMSIEQMEALEEKVFFGEEKVGQIVELKYTPPFGHWYQVRIVGFDKATGWHKVDSDGLSTTKEGERFTDEIDLCSMHATGKARFPGDA